MNRAMICAVFGVVTCALTHAAVSGVAPLRKEFIDGTRLVLKTAGCSFDLPGPEWKWMENVGNTTQNYLCINSRTNAIFLVAVGKQHIPLTDHQPKSLLENAKKSIGQRGGRIENDKYEFIEVTDVKKCVRTAFQEIEATGAKTEVILYLINTVDDVSIKLQSSTANSAMEPPAFKQLFASLKILKPAVPDAKKP